MDNREKSDWKDAFATLRLMYMLALIFYITHYIINYQELNYEYLGTLIKHETNVVRHDPKTHVFDEIGHVITYKTDNNEIKAEDFELTKDYKIVHANCGTLVYKNNQYKFLNIIFISVLIYLSALVTNIFISIDNNESSHWGNPIKIFISPFKCKY